MALKDELLALKPLLGTDSPEFYTKMREIAAKYNSEEDKKGKKIVIADLTKIDDVTGNKIHNSILQLFLCIIFVRAHKSEIYRL